MERIIGAVQEYQQQHENGSEESEHARAVNISRNACLENLKMEEFFAELL